MQKRKVMRKRELILLFLLFSVFISHLGANPVTGQYLLPRNSVKFENNDNYSLLPVGWSKKGNFALIIYNRKQWPGEEGSGIKLLIFDAIEDKEIWLSPFYSVDEVSGLVSVWNTQVDLFSEKLAAASIIPDSDPLYGGTLFTFNDTDYQIRSDEKRQMGIRGISSLSLIIKSETGGEKSLYNYSNNESGILLSEFIPLGYFKSPWEKRIAVISGENTSRNNDQINTIRVSGAHLTIGYKRVLTDEVKLIDAVLGGQFYNTRNLLEKGIDPNFTVAPGDPLIHRSARQGNWEIVTLLLKYGASINGLDKMGRTILHYAAISGEMNSCIYFLQNGANREITDSNGDSSFSLAKKNNFNGIADLLKY